jgi:hypothetical protein
MCTEFGDELLCINLHSKFHLVGVEASTPVTVASKHINTHVHIQITVSSILCRSLQVLFLPRVIQEDTITVIEESSANIKQPVSCTSRLALDF